MIWSWLGYCISNTLWPNKFNGKMKSASSRRWCHLMCSNVCVCLRAVYTIYFTPHNILSSCLIAKLHVFDLNRIQLVRIQMVHNGSGTEEQNRANETSVSHSINCLLNDQIAWCEFYWATISMPTTMTTTTINSMHANEIFRLNRFKLFSLEWDNWTLSCARAYLIDWHGASPFRHFWNGQ